MNLIVFDKIIGNEKMLCIEINDIVSREKKEMLCSLILAKRLPENPLKLK